MKIPPPREPYYNNAYITGVSNWMYWNWLDSIPAAERRRFNEAKDADEMVWLFERAMLLYPPDGLTGRYTP